MGQTLTNLSKKDFPGRPIFPNRFVVEICEKVHVHYKNLRLLLTVHDWVNLAEGMSDSLKRWKQRGCPGVSGRKHIELCRKKMQSEEESKDILVNLNKNLYNTHKDMIFSEGAEFDEETYIHLKIGDIRVELSKDQFGVLADAIEEAKREI